MSTKLKILENMEKELEFKVDLQYKYFIEFPIKFKVGTLAHQNSNIQKYFPCLFQLWWRGGGGWGGDVNFFKRLCYILQNSVRFAPHLNSGDYLHLIGRGHITQHDWQPRTKESVVQYARPLNSSVVWKCKLLVSLSASKMCVKM